MKVYWGSLPSKYCAASKTPFVKGSREAEPRRRGLMPAPAACAASSAAVAREPRGFQYFSSLATRIGYCSWRPRASCLSDSISAFQVATRDAESTTVEASLVSKLTE